MAAALTGVAAILGVAAALFGIGSLFKGPDYVIAGIGALAGRTVSVVIVQEAALTAGLVTVAVFPILIAALEGLIGFPLTSFLLRREALRLKGAYRAGNLAPVKEDAPDAASTSRLPGAFRTTVGTLFVVGIAVLVARFVDDVTKRHHQHLRGLPILGVLLRWAGLFKPSVLSGIDAYGLMITSISS